MQKQEIRNEENNSKRCRWSGRTLKGRYVPEHKLDPIPAWEWKFVFSIHDGKRIPTLLRGIVCGVCHNYAESESIALPSWMNELPSVELLDVKVLHLRRGKDDDEQGGVQ